HDPRVRALVLHAPTAFWFAYEGALRSVDLPILLLEPEKEEILPPGHAQIIADGVKDASKVDHRIVKGAGHFAALTPFPESMKRPNFPPAHDPAGFDRAAYQVQMNVDVAAFFDASLT
ncbi:MAG: alpha/beta hydrolase, partial [Polyangiaceae bacterium]